MIWSKSANKDVQVKTQRDEIERAELIKVPVINKRRREEKRKRNLDLVEETIQM